MEKKIKLLFASSDPIALPILEYLIEKDLVKCVLTGIDKRGRRKNTLVSNEIKLKAIEKNIPVLQFESLRTEARNEIKKYDCDTLLCFSYGKIFGPKFLSLFSNGCFNIHPSLLPKYRGSSPIQYTLLNNDKEGGITLQKLALEMDCGDIVSQLKFDLNGSETIETYTSFISKKAVILFKDSDLSISKKQEGEVSYTRKIEKEDRVIDFNSDIKVIFSKIRTYLNWPKAETTFDDNELYLLGVYGSVFDEFESCEGYKNGEIISFDKKKGIGVSVNNKILYITYLQKKCGKVLSALDFYNSNRNCIGKVLGA